MRLSWLLLCGVAACSPYNYNKEITAFSGDVDKLSTGVATGYDGLAADRRAESQRALLEAYQLDSNAKVDISPSCYDNGGKSAENAPQCALFQMGGTPSMPSSLELTRAPIMEKLAVLKKYTAALAAVTNATDRADYDASVTKLSDSVGALAKLAPGTPAAIAPAAINVIGWLVGTALDEQRFETLKATVNKVDTKLEPSGKRPMEVVADLLKADLIALSSKRQTGLLKEAGVQMRLLNQPGLSSAEYRQRLSDTQATLAAVEAYRVSDPAAAVNGLADAHHKLAEAVNDPKRSLEGLLTALGKFKDQVTALQAALASPPSPAAAKKGS